MPGNELPLYPTPQQATYAPGGQPRKLSKSSGYRQGSGSSSSYAHLQPSGSYQAQPQLRSNYQAPTPQQYYQQQQQQQQQHQHHQPPPQHPQQAHRPVQQTHRPPQNYQPAQPQYAPAPQPVAVAPAPQQYYQPQPAPQPPQQSTYHQAPAPQPTYTQPQYAHSPASASQEYVSHKKPSVASIPHHISRESLNDVASTSSKLSGKQKLELELRSVFDKVDSNRSGRISARELSMALLNFDHSRFQDSTIVLMVRLFSNGGSPNTALKTLNFEQFVSLWKYLSAYKKLFVAADLNRSGDISFGEFQKIIEQIGYKLNIDLVLHLFQKFSNKDIDSYDSGSVGKLKFDAFIELLVYLRKLTDIFKKYDKDLSGVATINFLDFLFEVSSLN